MNDHPNCSCAITKTKEEIQRLLDRREQLEEDIDGWNQEIEDAFGDQGVEDLETEISNAEAELEDIRLDLAVHEYKEDQTTDA